MVSMMQEATIISQNIHIRSSTVQTLLNLNSFFAFLKNSILCLAKLLVIEIPVFINLFLFTKTFLLVL